MGMALLAAVAAGLNPYATLFLVAALATYLGFSLPGLGTPSPPVLIAVVAVAGLALPLDLVLGKLVKRRRRNPNPAGTRRLPLVALVRRVDLLVGTLAGALVAVGLAGPAVSPLLAGVLGAGVAGLTGALLARCAERMRRDPSWRGLGHIPILIAATTTAVIVIPVGLIALGMGWALALLALVLLGAGALGKRRLLLRTPPPEPAPRSDAPIS